MNYKDIEKLTSVGHYQVDISLAYLKHTVERYISEYNLQLDPDFQRGHVWNENQQRAYVEFLLKGGVSSNICYFNHPGWMNSFKGEFVCVDGLQRITACIKFLDNKLSVFNNVYYKDIEDFPHISCELKFNINNLKTRKEVLKWYLEFNSGGTIHTEEELNKVKNLLEEEE